jgi:hypothetical protein
MHMPNALASRVKGHWRHRRALFSGSSDATWSPLAEPARCLLTVVQRYTRTSAPRPPLGKNRGGRHEADRRNRGASSVRGFDMHDSHKGLRGE